MAKLKKRQPEAQDPNDSATIDEVTSPVSKSASRVKHGPRPIRLMKGGTRNSNSKTDDAERLQSSNVKSNVTFQRETPQQPQDMDDSLNARLGKSNEQSFRLTFSPEDQLDLTPVKHKPLAK